MFEELDEELMDECMDDGCTCNCYDDMWESIGFRLEAGALIEEDGDGPYERKGVFPLLTLPGEIRDKIYGFAFLQSGTQRLQSGTRDSGFVNHRGSIHTALLGTCRQVYKEARHLPLTINKLCFSNPLFALDFLGFKLAPTARELVTGMHIEFYYSEFSNSSWRLLLREMGKMPLTHLGLTIKGGFPKEALLGHYCFTDRFKCLKGLNSLDLVLGSGRISDKAKKEIAEEMKEKLIQGYRRPKESRKSSKSKSKRTKPSGSDGSDKTPAKRVRKASKGVSTRSRS